MLLSEPSPRAAARVVAHDLTPVVYTEAGIDALAKAVADAGGTSPLDVHLKVDTGMHRVGCTPDDAVAARTARRRRATSWRSPGCARTSPWPTNPTTPTRHEQLARFDAVLDVLDDAGLRPPLAHAANSAGLLAVSGARYDLVRVGIACYGLPPAPALAGHDQIVLRPALSLAGPNHHGEGAARRAPGCPTACAPRSGRRGGSRPCPPGTPTACPATSAWRAARC